MIWTFVLAALTVLSSVGSEQSCLDLSKFVDWEHVVAHCKGKTVIGSSPSKFTLQANLLSEQEFNAFFENAQKIAMCVDIFDSDFVTIKFPKLTRWVSCTEGQPLRVIGNEKLERVEFNHSIKFLHTAGYAWHPEVVTIRGNRKLSYSMIEEISQLFSTYRFFKPRVGECSTPGLVTDLAQLNCRAYYGDIAFGQQLLGEIPTDEGYVDGCLIVKNSLLSDIEFLRGFHFKPSRACSNQIVNNSNLCISERLEKYLRSQMDIVISDNLPYSCRSSVDRTLVLELIIGLCFIIFSFMVTCVKVWTTD